MLTDEQREALFRAGDHHPSQCDCSAYIIEQAFAEDECCQGLLDTFAAVEAIVSEALAARETEFADWLWRRVFLQLPNTPSPLSDEVQRKVTDLRAAAIARGDQ